MNDMNLKSTFFPRTPQRNPLLCNRNIYDKLFRATLRGQCSQESQLHGIRICAEFAAKHHPGLFADPRLERSLWLFSERIPCRRNVLHAPASPPTTKPIVLHIVSELPAVGGHVRLLMKWISKDNDSFHLIAVTRKLASIPPFLTNLGRRHLAEVVPLWNPSLIETVRALQELISQADRIILHHHPDDLIPIIALAKQPRPPVALMNHAHFSFNLGSSVADVFINTFPYYVRLSRLRRHVHSQFLLSRPIAFGQKPYIDKMSAKRHLGFSKNDIVFLTIGAERYYHPDTIYNFFLTASKILKKEQRALVLAVGPDPSFRYDCVDTSVKTRIRCLGQVSDPLFYYQAADIVLESFPTPSTGAFTEAVMFGKAFPIPKFAKAETILCPNYPLDVGMPPRAACEEEYLEFVFGILKNLKSAHDAATLIHDRLWKMDEDWSKDLQNLYNLMDSVPCNPGHLDAPPLFAEDPDDHLLAESANAYYPFLYQNYFGYPQAKIYLVNAALQGWLPFSQVYDREQRFLRKAIQAVFR